MRVGDGNAVAGHGALALDSAGAKIRAAPHRAGASLPFAYN
jgi:hypothetical protein